MARKTCSVAAYHIMRFGSRLRQIMVKVKFTLRIANTQKPNSKQNAILIALACSRSLWRMLLGFRGWVWR